MAVAVVLAAGFLLFGRIAEAGDMRTRAQNGADATALGTLAPLRDRAVSQLLAGFDPSGAGYWLVGDPPETAARNYAERNDVRVSRVRLSGMLGTTALAEVATEDCQLKRDEELTDKERDDLRKRRNLCTDSSGEQGIGRSGTARAVAKMIPPECEFHYANAAQQATGLGPVVRITCGGVQAYPGGDRARVTRLFRIRLVDREDPIAYTGLPDGLAALAGPSGGGPAVVSECATEGKKPADDLPFGAAVVAWALCWRGTPYSWGGGTYRGPSRGICCSPGGYSGANTVGFDCSGLTLYAVYQASKGRIALGHYTGNQVADPRGQHVSTSALQPGDLLFFGSPVPHHVAIYYGDNKMVEAPRTGDVVRINPLRPVSAARRFG